VVSEPTGIDAVALDLGPEALKLVMSVVGVAHELLMKDVAEVTGKVTKLLDTIAELT